MNRYSKIIYNDWTKENGQFIDVGVLDWMLTRNKFNTEHFPTSSIKGVCRANGNIKDVHISGVIRDMPEDKLSNVSMVPTGKLSQIQNRGYRFECERLMVSKPIGDHLIEKGKDVAYRSFQMMRNSIIFEDARKMFIQNACLGGDHVYIVSDIHNRDRVKIGVSKNVAQRIYQLDREFNTSFFIHTVLVGAGYAAEKALHDYLSDAHIEREFFYKSELVDDLINYGRLLRGYEFTERCLQLSMSEIPF